MNDTDLIRRIMIGLRMAIGVGAMLVPVTTGKLFGLDIRSGGIYMTRLFAARELILAYQLYQASDDELEEICRQGMLIDSTDTVTALVSFARGDIGVRAFVLGGGAAAAAVAMGNAVRPGLPPVEHQ